MTEGEQPATEPINLVTGANGHLGNNLVRALLAKGHTVRAGTRNLEATSPFDGLACQLVHLELMDKESAIDAMAGVDTLYHVAALFRHWSQNPEEEIIRPNLKMVKNVLEAAAEQKVRRIVFVSSMAALDHDAVPMDESTWSSEFHIPYYQAKTEAEKLAWRLSEELDLWMVSVLPSSMVGPNCFGHLTTTMNLLQSILTNSVPIDPGFSFNYVDVRDVAEGMISAAKNGRNGERYILGNELATSTIEVMKLANALFPEVNVPASVSKNQLIELATALEKEAGATGKAPLLQVGHIETYHGKDQALNISKSVGTLGFHPKPPEEALKEAFQYLRHRLN